MKKKAWISLFLAVVLFLTAVVLAFCGRAKRTSATQTKTYPFLKDTSIKTFVTDDVQKTYGKSVTALNNYANYGFREVLSTPLADVSFDKAESLDNLSGESVGLSNSAGAKLVTGRFGLRRALEFTKPETYLTVPDMGVQDALTISMWVNIRDLQTRENPNAPRVSTLLRSVTAGRGYFILTFARYEDAPRTSAMRKTISASGKRVPLSQRAIVEWLTNICFPNCSCVIPFSFRSFFSVSANSVVIKQKPPLSFSSF